MTMSGASIRSSATSAFLAAQSMTRSRLARLETINCGTATAPMSLSFASEQTDSQ